jgi:hypothetical protein
MTSTVQRTQLRSFGHAAWAAAVVVTLALNLLWPLPGQEASWMWVGGLMAFPGAAAVILARRPGNGVGHALGLVGGAAPLWPLCPDREGSLRVLEVLPQRRRRPLTSKTSSPRRRSLA